MGKKYIVESNIKEAFHNAKLSVKPEFFDALEEEVKELIRIAVKRAKANNRTTIMAKDVGF